eukprot:13753430-Heterocapsa_arctica.AAC.1
MSDGELFRTALATTLQGSSLRDCPSDAMRKARTRGPTKANTLPSSSRGKHKTGNRAQESLRKALP